MSKIEDERSRIRNEIYTTLEKACSQGRWFQVSGSIMALTLYPKNDYEYGIILRFIGDTRLVQNTLWPSKRARVTFECTKSKHKIRVYLSVPWEGSLAEGGWVLNKELLLSKLGDLSLQLTRWKEQDYHREKTMEMFQIKAENDFGHLGIVDTHYNEETWAQVAVVDADWGHIVLSSYSCGETYNITGIRVDKDLRDERIKRVLEEIATQWKEATERKI